MKTTQHHRFAAKSIASKSDALIDGRYRVHGT